MVAINVLGAIGLTVIVVLAIRFAPRRLRLLAESSPAGNQQGLALRAAGLLAGNLMLTLSSKPLLQVTGIVLISWAIVTLIRERRASHRRSDAR